MAEGRLGFEAAVGVGESVQVVDEGTHGAGYDVMIAAVGEARDGVPVPAGADDIGKFEEGHLAFEAGYAIESGDHIEGLDMTQAGEVTAHDEVTGDACIAQLSDDKVVLQYVELEDEREAYDHWTDRLGGLDDEIWVGLDIADDDSVSMAPQGGSEIAEAEVSLVLEADKQDGTGGVALWRGFGSRLEECEL